MFSIAAPILPAVAAQHGASGGDIAQFLFALPSLGLVLVGLVGGRIVDTVGARTPIILATAAYMILGVVPMIVNSVAPLLVSRLLLGTACGLITTASAVILVGRYEGEERSAMFGYQSAAGSAVGLLALVAAGMVATRADWHLAFVLYTIPMLPLLILATMSVPKLTPKYREKTSGIFPVLALLWPIYLAGFLLFILPAMLGAQTPFLLSARGITSPVAQSLVIAMTTVGSMSGAAGFGRLHGVLGIQRCFGLSLALCAAGALVVGAAPTAMLAGIGSLVAGLGIGLVFPHLWVVTGRIAMETMRARAIAMLSTAMFLGGFAYPLVIGAIVWFVGRAGAFLVVGGILMVASLAVVAAKGGRLTVGRA